MLSTMYGEFIIELPSYDDHGKEKMSDKNQTLEEYVAFFRFMKANAVKDIDEVAALFGLTACYTGFRKGAVATISKESIRKHEKSDHRTSITVFEPKQK